MGASIVVAVMVLLAVVAVAAQAQAQAQDATTGSTGGGSNQKVLAANLQRCATPDELNADDVVDYFPEKFVPRYYSSSQSDGDSSSSSIYVPHNTTDLLSITYHNTYKIVENKFHNTSYLLYQCGTEPPADLVESGNFQLVLPVPHRGGLAITETVQIPPIELLGLRSELLAYIGNPTWVSSPCLQYLMTTEEEENDVGGNSSAVQVIYNPDDPYNATWTAAATAEFLDRNPDAIVFGGPYYDDARGDRVVSVAGSQERTNVATFDWIALYASLYNLEGLSNRIAADTQQRYDCSSRNAAALLSSSSEDDRKRPTVLWATYFDGLNWSVAECPTWDAAYYCEYARHCGAEIVSRPEGFGSNVGGYWYLNDEQLLELGKDADYWIIGGRTWNDTYQAKKEVLDQFKSVQNRQVYDTQGQGPYSWHEQRLAEYDVVALDFCDLVGNADPNQFPPHQRRWFRNVFTEPVGSPGTCDVDGGALYAPYVPQGADCIPLVLDDNGNINADGSSSAGLSSLTSLAVLLLLGPIAGAVFVAS